MVGLAYFDTAGGLTQSGDPSAGVLVKNALVLIEGTHKDNKGVIHDFPASRIQLIAQNTNHAMSRGFEVPFISDHSKELISNGSLKKLGEIIGNIDCRTIGESDLPNPKMRHLIGKFGAFAKVAVKNRIEDVEKGLIKLLSPGIDLAKERLGEVSAVMFPAIQGPALFAQFALDYDEAKQQNEAVAKQKDKVSDCLNILFSVVQSIDSVSPEQIMGIDPNALKREASEKFFRDLTDILDIQNDITSTEQIIGTPTPTPSDSSSIYYSEESEQEIEQLPKRRLKKSNFTMASNHRVIKK